jgi:hypothetical protein
MKTKLIKRFSKLFAVLAFLTLLAGNAFAIENKTRVVSPYWQSDSGSYTFIAVSHTSLSGMASQIGLTLTALGSDNVTFGSAVEFTVESGNTTRVFIVRTNQATINPTGISTAKFISGTTNFTHGHVLIAPLATAPNTATGDASLTGDGYRDVTMLSYWGSVVIEQNTTGFAMEFIGDMSDSAATSVLIGSTPVAGPAAP